jgi:hypothetical protein
MPNDHEPMPTEEDIAALHREIQVKAIMVDALRAAANTPLLGLPLSPRSQATVYALLRQQGHVR